jgi:hypothetical protein
MENNSLRYRALRFLKIIAIIDVIALIINGVICWFIGWRSYIGYSNGLMFIGGIAAVIALFNSLGSFLGRGNFKYQYTSTAGMTSSHEQAKNDAELMKQSSSFFIYMVSVSISLFILSYVVVKVFESIN